MEIDEREPFNIEFDNALLEVTEHYIGEDRIFRVLFDDKRKPLTLVVALSSSQKKFWTSMPQGRQEEAELIGPLIAMHYKNNKQ